MRPTRAPKPSTTPSAPTRCGTGPSSRHLRHSRSPRYNVIISNVPGPPFPLYLAGGRVEALYPLGPVFDGLGLNITVLSYIDSVGFGFIADRDGVPDLAELASLVPDAIGELIEAT